jgi:hypothetical protein
LNKPHVRKLCQTGRGKIALVRWCDTALFQYGGDLLRGHIAAVFQNLQYCFLPFHEGRQNRVITFAACFFWYAHSFAPLLIYLHIRAREKGNASAPPLILDPAVRRGGKRAVFVRSVIGQQNHPAPFIPTRYIKEKKKPPLIYLLHFEGKT